MTYTPTELDNPALGIFFGSQQKDGTDYIVDKTTPWRVFCGQNIKGTPHMPAGHATHDIGVITHIADVVVAQEFKWLDYWSGMIRLLPPHEWHMYPTRVGGVADPIKGAQFNLWRASAFVARDHMLDLLMSAHRDISEDRYLRATLLADRQNEKLSAWYGSTHFIPGADGPHDPADRKAVLRENLDRLDRFLTRLVATGYPIVFELDANIHHTFPAFQELNRIVKKHGGEFHGKLGVEYAFTCNNRHGNIEVEKAWTIPTDNLFTDHEGRLLKYRVTGTGTTVTNK